MSKSRAALTHLWPSVLVFALIACLILLVWYPHPFLQFEDTGKFSLLLVTCATLIGPALTWLVYRKGKRGLKLDLIVIVLIQVVALGWGTRALYLNRPYFMVFTVDRFEVLSVLNVDIASITDPRFLKKPFARPILLYASMPTDEEEFQKLIKEIMFEGKPDLQFRPEHWSLYTENQQHAARASRPVEKLRNARPESRKAIDKLLKKNDRNIDGLGFVPGIAQNGQFAAILDVQSGELVGTLVVDPWLK